MGALITGGAWRATGLATVLRAWSRSKGVTDRLKGTVNTGCCPPGCIMVCMGKLAPLVEGGGISGGTLLVARLVWVLLGPGKTLVGAPVVVEDRG
jgi:hypothetical protein